MWCGARVAIKIHLCGDSQQAHSFRTRASAQERAYLRGHGSPSLYVSTLNDGRRSDSTQPHRGHRLLCLPAVEPCRHHLWPTLWAKKSAVKRHATSSLTLPFTLSDYSPLCAQVIRQAIRPRNCAWRARSSAEKGTLARGERRVHTTLFTSEARGNMYLCGHGPSSTARKPPPPAPGEHSCSPPQKRLVRCARTDHSMLVVMPHSQSPRLSPRTLAVFDVDKLDQVSDQIKLTRSGF